MKHSYEWGNETYSPIAKPFVLTTNNEIISK